MNCGEPFKRFMDLKILLDQLLMDVTETSTTSLNDDVVDLCKYPIRMILSQLHLQHLRKHASLGS